MISTVYWESKMDQDRRCRSEHLNESVISLAIELARVKTRLETCEQVQVGLSSDAETLEDLAFAIDEANAKLARIYETPDGIPLVRFEGLSPDRVDDILWPTFGCDERLQHPGGWCVLENVIEDMFDKSEGDLRADIQRLDFDEVVASAERWCEVRSSWFRNRRYRVEPVGDWLIIKRNRFLFQVRSR